MFCSHCGKEINENAAFCPYCGSPQMTGQNPVSREPRPKSKHTVKPAAVIAIAAVVLVVALGAGIVFGGIVSDNGNAFTETFMAKPQLSEVNKAAAKAAVDAVDQYNSDNTYFVTTAEKAVRHAIDSMEPAQDEASEEITSQLEYYMDKLDIELSRFSWLDNELDTDAVMQYRNLIAELAELD